MALRATCDIQMPRSLHFACISTGNKIIMGLFFLCIHDIRIRYYEYLGILMGSGHQAQNNRKRNPHAHYPIAPPLLSPNTHSMQGKIFSSRHQCLKVLSGCWWDAEIRKVAESGNPICYGLPCDPHPLCNLFLRVARKKESST